MQPLALRHLIPPGKVTRSIPSDFPADNCIASIKRNNAAVVV